MGAVTQIEGDRYKARIRVLKVCTKERTRWGDGGGSGQVMNGNKTRKQLIHPPKHVSTFNASRVFVNVIVSSTVTITWK